MDPFAGWDNFYVIAGSSAGALIGLQFVVITLIANIPMGQSSEQAGRAFATPTVVHFGAVLLLAGIMTAPWDAIAPAAVLWGLLGLIGVVYAVVVARRMQSQGSYRPELEDWLFHAVMPFVGYVALAVSAILVCTHVRRALFVSAAAAWFCSSSAFITPGTPLPITCSSREIKSSSRSAKRAFTPVTRRSRTPCGIGALY